MADRVEGEDFRLTPGAIVQAAEADLRRRQRNKETLDAKERYAFLAKHVRKDSVEKMIEAALNSGEIDTTKRNTLMIYADKDVLRRALEQVRANA